MSHTGNSPAISRYAESLLVLPQYLISKLGFGHYTSIPPPSPLSPSHPLPLPPSSQGWNLGTEGLGRDVGGTWVGSELGPDRVRGVISGPSSRSPFSGPGSSVFTWV